LTGSSALSRQGQGRETRPQAKAHRASMQGGDPSARQGRGVAGRDWPQLQRERMDDREACVLTRKTLFGTPPAKRTKRLPPGMVCNRLARARVLPCLTSTMTAIFASAAGVRNARSAQRAPRDSAARARITSRRGRGRLGHGRVEADGRRVIGRRIAAGGAPRGRNAEGSRHSLYGGTAPTADIGHTSTIVVVTIAMSLLRCIS
jgi:hypothetical protein